MITIDELNQIRDDVASAEVDILRRNSFGNGFDLAISTLRYHGLLKDEPQPPTGPTVKVRLPVVVLQDGRYSSFRSTFAKDEDCLQDAESFSERNGGRTFVVTAELPIQQKPKPVEVQGEVEA